MSARRFLLGSLTVEVDAPLADGVAGDLLGGFAAAPPGGAELRIAPVAAEAARPQPGEVPSFFHGPLRALRRGERFVLRDGATAVLVSAHGRLLEIAGPARAAEGCSELALLAGLVLALRAHGLFHLHAAALHGPAGRGILVAGTTGAGKTTLALALAAAGSVPLADDAVLVSSHGGAISVVGVPRPFHLGPRTAAAFPDLARHLGPPTPAGKRPLPLRALGPGPASGTTSAPDVLLLPEVAPGGPTAVEPVSPADALGALLECGALLAADGMPAVPEQLAVLRIIAARARAARVRLGEDLLRAPAAAARAVLAAVERRARRES